MIFESSRPKRIEVKHLTFIFIKRDKVQVKNYEIKSRSPIKLNEETQTILTPYNSRN